MEPHTDDRTPTSPRRPRRTVAGIAAAVAALAGGGAAIAATTLSGPQQESEAIISDAAERLGVEPDKLSQALEQAYEAQLDERVADGSLDREDADRLKQELESGDVPLVQTPRAGRGEMRGGFGFGHHGRAMHVVDLDAAATYLGLSEDALRERLRDGETLAEIATAQGKTADGVAEALTDAATKALDERVASGDLTEEQKAEILERLPERIQAMVQGELRGPGRFGHHGGPWGVMRGADVGEAAAAYLGLSEAELRSRLRDGDTLAEIATAEGKTADGLTKAITDAITRELDERVAAGDMTAEQKAAALERLSEHIEAMVEGKLRLHRGPAPDEMPAPPGEPAPPAGTTEDATA